MRTFSTKPRLLRPRPGQGCHSGRTDDMFLLSLTWTQEVGLPTKAEIPGIWDIAVSDIGGTGTNTVCSFSPRYGSEEPVLVVECYASTFGSTDKPYWPGHGSRSRTWLSGRDFGDPGECLCRCTTG